MTTTPELAGVPPTFTTMKTKTKIMTAGGLILAAMLLACNSDEAEAGKMNDAATTRAEQLAEAAKLIEQTR